MAKDRIRKITGFERLGSTFENREKIILRDFLSMERTTLANERTLFSYLRSSIYLILAGIAFIQLEEFENIRWVAFILFVFSALALIYGIIRFFSLKRKLSIYYKSMENERKASKMGTEEESKVSQPPKK